MSYLVVTPVQGSLGKLTTETRGLKYLAVFLLDNLFSEAFNPQIILIKVTDIIKSSQSILYGNHCNNTDVCRFTGHTILSN